MSNIESQLGKLQKTSKQNVNIGSKNAKLDMCARNNIDYMHSLHKLRLG